MGDSTSVQIIIGGPLRRDMIDEVLQAAELERLTLNWSSGPDLTKEVLTAAAAKGEPLVLSATSVNYGNVDEMEELCRTLGLTYRKEWDAGGSYGAGGEVVGPGLALSYTIGEIGEGPSIDAATIRKLGSWDALMARLADLEGEVPPLTLVDAPEADLAEASDGATCQGCGRPELDCSRDPCPAVIADREA